MCGGWISEWNRWVSLWVRSGLRLRSWATFLGEDLFHYQDYRVGGGGCAGIGHVDLTPRWQKGHVCELTTPEVSPLTAPLSPPSASPSHSAKRHVPPPASPAAVRFNPCACHLLLYSSPLFRCAQSKWRPNLKELFGSISSSISPKSLKPTCESGGQTAQ